MGQFKCAVVIPVYKEKNSPNEMKSILNTCSKLKDIFIVAPENLNSSELEHQLNSRASIIRFNDTYFKNIEGYNKLLLSKQFYKKFEKYDFMLIVQPDAWVFKNEIDEWCNRGFDYIGSPWVSVRSDGELHMEPFGGNGGFSLRNIKSAIRTLSIFKIMDNPRQVWNYHRQFHNVFGITLRLPIILLRILGYQNNSFRYTRNFSANEDVYWSTKATVINKKFKVAPVESEIAFGFEKFPSALYKMINNELPFGCHAWEKYELDFWKNYIKQ